MGQALDKDGNVLGEAEGASKREVLDKLEREHKDAAEVRIRSAVAESINKGAQVSGAIGNAGAPGVTGPAGPSTERGQAIPPDRMLQFFRYEHLPPHLQEASEPFCRLARHVVARYPSNPERTVALRKLLEAKDAAVRALLYEG